MKECRELEEGFAWSIIYRWTTEWSRECGFQGCKEGNKEDRQREFTVKTFGLLQPLFQLPQLHVCGVCIMKFKECFQSSEDLEIKSFFFNNQSSFRKTNQLPFLERIGYIVMVEMPVMYM